jgi:hypothetical protein
MHCDTSTRPTGRDIVKICCPSFAQAHEPRTDDEGYGRLICENGGDHYISFGFPPITFCPWCGTPVSPRLEVISDKPAGWQPDWQEVCSGRGETLYWIEPNGTRHRMG